MRIVEASLRTFGRAYIIIDTRAQKLIPTGSSLSILWQSQRKFEADFLPSVPNFIGYHAGHGYHRKYRKTSKTSLGFY